MRMAHAIAVLLGTMIGCGNKAEPATTGTSEPETKIEVTPKVDRDPCSADALALGKATTLAAWTPPTGCTETAAQGTSIHRTEAELATQLDCEAKATHGVDLTKHAVLRVTDSMSPATVGWLAYDDGKIITLVTKFRSPCPNDPRPMPITATRWYLAPTADRTIAEATCTIHPECPK